jgi:phage shock protein E
MIPPAHPAHNDAKWIGAAPAPPREIATLVCILAYPAQVKKPSSLLVLSLPAMLLVGCGSNASTTDAAPGSRDGLPGIVAEVGAAPGDVAADSTGQARDAVLDSAFDRQAAKEDIASATRDSTSGSDAGRSDGSADTGPADGMPDAAAADSVVDIRSADAGSEPRTRDTGTASLDMPPADAGCAGWNTLARLSPAAAADLMATIDPIVINVHIPYEGDIPGTDTSIPYNNVNAIDTYLRQDHCAEILLVCKGGGMSKSAGDQLIKLGYLRVRDLAGGMEAWTAAGYPLLKDGGT